MVTASISVLLSPDKLDSSIFGQVKLRFPIRAVSAVLSKSCKVPRQSMKNTSRSLNALQAENIVSLGEQEIFHDSTSAWLQNRISLKNSNSSLISIKCGSTNHNAIGHSVKSRAQVNKLCLKAFKEEERVMQISTMDINFPYSYLKKGEGKFCVSFK